MNEEFMREAIKLALEGMRANTGGPFGAIVVKNGEIIGRGNNAVTTTNDPTAHAEVMAIREACANLNTFQLDGCEIYTSCEPCPMCLGAIYWARTSKLYYACSKSDAAAAGFDDDFIYKEIDLPGSERKIAFVQLLQEEAQEIFSEWIKKEDKVNY
ncbi:MAG TPA: nucleoside deaminase [Flavobacteriales bacterium]|nr:nucleoside deaminase [Flavobacteriales bacterium]HIO71791.1 nucleoside deaminase [Flavobacteriales bacterium]